MPQETDRLKLPLPLGNENVTRESINGIFEKIDAGVATHDEVEVLRQLMSEMDIPDASLTVKGKVQLSDAINDTSTDKAATPNAIKQAYDLANEKQNAIKLVNNFATPEAAITLYPEGISVFYVGGGAGGQGLAWKTATGANESFGYVETVKVGTGGYQTYTEMYSGTDPANQTNNKHYKRNKRDSNISWQPFERVLDVDDYNAIVAYVDESNLWGAL
ncbi:Phage tail fibre repeat-containing protein [Paenibacillus sp. CF095]|uniref:phage tail protein n=1 Tax=Paenibacillus sp. CF095 TaxID=1881033 RepID=UPI00088BB7EF|nr:phage tail protein [Paenibacillus sp. CF095]SDD02350.1 Phage tail fibre repeat-containing protein [Paenibacillus sp. CF095]